MIRFDESDYEDYEDDEDLDDEDLDDLDPNQLAFVLDDVEDKVKFQELIAALRAAQVYFEVSAHPETDETIVTYEESRESDVYSAMLALGIETFDDSDLDNEGD